MNQNVFDILQWEKKELRKRQKRKEYQRKYVHKRKEIFYVKHKNNKEHECIG